MVSLGRNGSEPGTTASWEVGGRERTTVRNTHSGRIWQVCESTLDGWDSLVVDW